MTKQQTDTDTEKTPSRYIPHDRLFKEFFRRFLAEFMQLFYPAKAARLDLDKPKFIDKELVINIPGKVMRITDVVAVVPVRDAEESSFLTTVDDNIVRRKKRDEEQTESEKEEEFIVVHVDAEANKPKPIPNRMFEYYGLLRIVEGKPVLPIALILRRRSFKAGIEPDMDADSNKMRTYTERLWGEELLKFRYYEIVLQDLLSEEYLDLNDPVAASLAVLMKHPKEMSAFIKKQSLDVITQNDTISVGDRHFLEGFVQEYVPDREVRGGTEVVMKQLAEYRLSYRERIEMEAQQNFLIGLLRTKFQEIADDLIERIKAIEDGEILMNIAQQLMFIQSPDELALPEPA